MPESERSRKLRPDAADAIQSDVIGSAPVEEVVAVPAKATASKSFSVVVNSWPEGVEAGFPDVAWATQPRPPPSLAALPSEGYCANNPEEPVNSRALVITA